LAWLLERRLSVESQLADVKRLQEGSIAARAAHSVLSQEGFGERTRAWLARLPNSGRLRFTLWGDHMVAEVLDLLNGYVERAYAAAIQFIRGSGSVCLI
jgi:hypothetical protein